MHGSKSDYYGFRRPTFSFGNRATEHLGTIREDARERLLIDNYDGMKLCPPVTSSPPRKSNTFHGLYDLRKDGRKCKVQNRSTHIVTQFSSQSSSSTGAPTSSTSSEYKQKVKRIPSHTDSSISPSSTCSTLTIPRKRSIFYEMGERIRLFSTASFVSPATTSSGTVPSRQRCSEPTTEPTRSNGASQTTVTGGPGGTTVCGLAKSHSLNSFEETSAPLYVSTTRCPSGGGRKTRTEQPQKTSRIDAIGSLLSLPGHEDSIGIMEPDLEKGLEKDVSQLGILCHHCSTTDLTCPKTTQKELPSPSASSVYSLARSDMSNEPLCRICHCCWPPDSNDPLISPCRCSGSLQYVHVSCLMHWLDISSRKLHRPAICELCLYKYRRRRVLKYREMKLPQCAQADIRYYTLFVIAILLMILSAFATVVCFQLEKTYGLQADRGNRTLSPLNVEGVASDLGPSPPPPPSIKEVPEETTPMVVLGARKRIGDITVSASSKDEYRRDDAENILSTVTLIAAMVFFLSFFLAMYAHVKSGLSFCGYLTLCWSSNLEWSIEEYKHSRDTQYLNKLEELRRKINEKQKKAADEVEPLRSSVIVLE